MARDVFISYTSQDKETADRICAALEKENVSCWIAPRDIPPGHVWATAIEEGLDRSKTFVLVLSANSKNARNISREVELADQRGLPMITFRIEDVQTPPGLTYFLSNIQWLDAFGNRFDSAVARLAEVVRQSGNYPAPKTGMFPAVTSDAAGAAPAQEKPAAKPAPPPAAALPTAATPSRTEPVERAVEASPAASSSSRWIVIGAAVVVVLGVVIWLLARPRPQPHPHREPRAVAEKFINDRDSGNYDAAWSETVPGFNDGVKRKQWEARTEKESRGKVQSVSDGTCQPDGDDYSCQFTLTYENGRSAENRIELKRTGNGSWGIWRSDIQTQTR